MGLEVLVAAPASPDEPVFLGPMLERLRASGTPATIMMVDGTLVMPGAPPPAKWRDVRLRTPAGMVTLARRVTGIAVVVFDNADAALRAAQQRVAEALGAQA